MKDISLKNVGGDLGHVADKLKRYAGFFFFILIALVYGFIVLRINTLSSVEIDQSQAASQIKSSPSPKIDLATVKQLQALKDNSVNVQTLFEQQRNNPFRE